MHFFTGATLAAAADASGLDIVEQRSTRLARGASVNAVAWDHTGVDLEGSPAPRSVLDIVDGDPESDVHVLTWALRPR